MCKQKLVSFSKYALQKREFIKKSKRKNLKKGNKGKLGGGWVRLRGGGGGISCWISESW